MTEPTEPEKTVILREASKTVAFLQALSQEPDYRVDLSTIPSRSAGLTHIVGFVVTTFRNYWPLLISAEKMAEFSASLEQFNGVSKEEKMRTLEEWWGELKQKNPSFDTSVWPKYDRKTLSDSIGRNLLAAMIVQDPEKQAMMGGKYTYGDQVKQVCDMITEKAQAQS